MKTDLREPCSECPFRRDSAKGYLGPLTIEDIQLHISYLPFACHKTIKEDLSWDDPQVENLQMCAGAAIHLNNQAKLSRSFEVTQYQRDLRSVSDVVKEGVFKWPSEFHSHHSLVTDKEK